MSAKQDARGKKAQHFVPQCYLRAWHDPVASRGPQTAPYVWVFDEDGTNCRNKSPKNIFVEKDIYTIIGRNGQRDLRLENGFQTLEDKFTRIRNLKLHQGEWPDPEEMCWLLAFAATAQIRTLANRDFQRAQWDGLRDKMERMLTTFDGMPPEKKMVFRQRQGKDAGKGLTLEHVRELSKNPIQLMLEPMISTALPMLTRMHTCVMCTDDKTGFITSDHPCTWFDPTAYRLQPIFRGPALGAPNIEVTLPISPRQCLLVTHNPELTGFIEISDAVLDEINRRHIAHCSKSFVSNSSDAPAKWFKVRPLPDDAWEKVRERKMAAGEW